VLNCECKYELLASLVCDFLASCRSFTRPFFYLLFFVFWLHLGVVAKRGNARGIARFSPHFNAFSCDFMQDEIAACQVFTAIARVSCRCLYFFQNRDNGAPSHFVLSLDEKLDHEKNKVFFASFFLCFFLFRLQTDFVCKRCDFFKSLDDFSRHFQTLKSSYASDGEAAKL